MHLARGVDGAFAPTFDVGLGHDGDQLSDFDGVDQVHASLFGSPPRKLRTFTPGAACARCGPPAPGSAPPAPIPAPARSRRTRTPARRCSPTNTGPHPSPARS